MSRLELQTELETFLGSTNVYFQPPESVKLKYPCIIYNLSSFDLKKADNIIYNKKDTYNIKIVHYDPDNTLKDEILNKFEYISPTSFYVVDNLYHYTYTLKY